MRYAAANKPDSEPLDRFIRRKGGINECANAFLSAAGAESGNDVTETVGESLTMVEALIFRALSLV